jgi:hypothetical protein
MRLQIATEIVVSEQSNPIMTLLRTPSEKRPFSGERVGLISMTQKLNTAPKYLIEVLPTPLPHLDKGRVQPE